MARPSLITIVRLVAFLLTLIAIDDVAPASAHPELERTVPAADALLAAPTNQIDLWFTERIDVGAGSPTIELIDENGERFATTAQVDRARGRRPPARACRQQLHPAGAQRGRPGRLDRRGHRRAFAGQGAGAPAGLEQLHPAQRAMVECHGSQCGFCTPGFVMSLFALHHQCAGAAISREQAQHALSGNLCRCTGYRPIVDAATRMHHWSAPPIDEAGILQKLELLAPATKGLEADLAPNSSEPFYARPATLAELVALRAAQPQALIVAGSTDVGLWVTKQHRHFPQIIDVTRCAELLRIERGATHLAIGAAASLNDAFAALAADRPQLTGFFDRFAGLPVRESGTLGGNVANGSPIGDSMPLLIALGTELVLASPRGERTLPIEDFYLAYRQTAGPQRGAGPHRGAAARAAGSPGASRRAHGELRPGAGRQGQQAL